MNKNLIFLKSSVIALGIVFIVLLALLIILKINKKNSHNQENSKVLISCDQQQIIFKSAIGGNVLFNLIKS